MVLVNARFKEVGSSGIWRQCQLNCQYIMTKKNILFEHICALANYFAQLMLWLGAVFQRNILGELIGAHVMSHCAVDKLI